MAKKSAPKTSLTTPNILLHHRIASALGNEVEILRKGKGIFRILNHTALEFFVRKYQEERHKLFELVHKTYPETKLWTNITVNSEKICET